MLKGKENKKKINNIKEADLENIEKVSGGQMLKTKNLFGIIKRYTVINERGGMKTFYSKKGADKYNEAFGQATSSKRHHQ